MVSMRLRLRNFYFFSCFSESVDLRLSEKYFSRENKLELLIIKKLIFYNLITYRHISLLHVQDLDRIFSFSLNLSKSKLRIYAYILNSLKPNTSLFNLSTSKRHLNSSFLELFRSKIRKTIRFPILGFQKFFDDEFLDSLLLTNIYLTSRSTLPLNFSYSFFCFFYLAY